MVNLLAVDKKIQKHYKSHWGKIITRKLSQDEKDLIYLNRKKSSRKGMVNIHA